MGTSSTSAPWITASARRTGLSAKIPNKRGMYDLALANVSGAITQNAVLVMPVALIMLAAFSQVGVIAALPNGAVLPIDLETTSVVLLLFPPLLILWKAVKDDGRVSWSESAAMVAVFGLTLYFLAEHG